MYTFLDRYKSPEDIKKMSIKELDFLAEDIRRFLIDKVSETGGHLASNLGVVELTLSLFNVFDFQEDRIVWDVGHQSYVHKILTGRKDQFDKLRKYKGLSGFPKRAESPYDYFDTGHSSTSISAALGMARARDIMKEKHNVIAVIGDGALTGGMALEALNDVGFHKTKLIVILNDNQMSISKNVGGLSTYLSNLRIDPSYNKLKSEFNSTLEKTILGKNLVSSIERVKDSIKQFVVPGMLFEEMGIKYLGPIDGHNIKEVSKMLSQAKNLNGPVLIHTITQKGKGYNFAEENPNKFHGVGPFDLTSGEISASGAGENYSKVFGLEMEKIAEENSNVVAITAAMPDGTGLKNFSKKYPDRFFDVGIAEQHAVTLAAGMAKEGLKPVFAVYSTFLQRSYDQILHDVCIQKLPVVFAIDRAGIVGEDGETHQGIFDLSYLSHIPNMTVAAPKCMDELKSLLRWSINQKFPIAIRYPRGCDLVKMKSIENIKLGNWEVVKHGEKIAIIASGKMVQHAVLAKEKLEGMGINPLIINACFVKPIDKDLIAGLVKENYKIITVEDNIVKGGLGSAVLQYINTLDHTCKITIMGYKDEFVEHGETGVLYKLHHLDPEAICDEVIKLC
ncbi:1-deoxy-D-xylulose-5-phosphate synthase [Clostridium polynesiense]|uniref:1-deoxy-D-xylulose-5-phosphate synthase n=1 Tax=Clostridium polynesiense TaxID=1325933 RepID=UPI0005911B5A|nr:1-deoxy-D-xylulose-5-phosphate synthase [Clostridium polynesiense]